MTAQRGTGRSVAKAAITEALRARPELSDLVDGKRLQIFDPPGPRPDQIEAIDGTAVDLLWVQDSDQPIDVDVVVLEGGNPVNYDELVRVDVVIQSIRRGDSATMADADRAAEEIYGEVIGTLASNADIVDGGTDDPTVDGVEAVIESTRATGAWLADGTGFGTRFEVGVVLEARLVLD